MPSFICDIAIKDLNERKTGNFNRAILTVYSFAPFSFFCTHSGVSIVSDTIQRNFYFFLI